MANSGPNVLAGAIQEIRETFQMQRPRHFVVVLLGVFFSVYPSLSSVAQPGRSTRVTDPKRHRCIDPKSYPYRAQSAFVLKELDLLPGEVVVDIGAGDGWWSERFGRAVGDGGIVHAAEVDKKKVDSIKKRLADIPQIQPYLCQPDSTTLPENSCDMAFFSQVYHHLESKSRVDYLRHLRKVVKPSGRLAVIEKYATIATRKKDHGTPLSVLITEAEQAGWIPLRCELLTGTYHYLAVFGQRSLFPPEPERKEDEARRRLARF
jgi:ubiquinone/menaquinone biosynthesis C-methylase UbiE